MSPPRNRKAPKRTRRASTPNLTSDMRDLMVALQQNSLDEGIEATLTLPWRNGWNAVRLGIYIIDRIYAGLISPEPRGTAEAKVLIALYDQASPKLMREADYWYIEEKLPLHVSDWGWPMLRSAQVMLTERGWGDGSIFNAIWNRHLVTSNVQRSEMIADAMMHARCRDVLGVDGPSLQNDKNDFYRRAFKTAWEARLYRAAYSLPYVGPTISHRAF